MIDIDNEDGENINYKFVSSFLFNGEPENIEKLANVLWQQLKKYKNIPIEIVLRLHEDYFLDNLPVEQFVLKDGGYCAMVESTYAKYAIRKD